MESSIDFAGITTVVADIHLPELFSFLTDLDQFQDPMKSKVCTTIQGNQAQEGSTPSKSPRENKNTASEMLDGAPHAKVPWQDPACFAEGEGAEDSAGARERPAENKPKYSDDTAQHATPKNISKAKDRGQEMTKMSEKTTERKAKSISRQEPK